MQTLRGSISPEDASMFIPAEPTSAHPIALAKLTWLDCYACAYDDNIVCVDVTMLLLTNDVVSQRRLVLYIATIVVCSCNSVACQNSPHSHRFQPALRPWPSLVPKLAHATSSVAVVNAYPWCVTLPYRFGQATCWKT